MLLQKGWLLRRCLLLRCHLAGAWLGRRSLACTPILHVLHALDIAGGVFFEACLAWVRWQLVAVPLPKPTGLSLLSAAGSLYESVVWANVELKASMEGGEGAGMADIESSSSLVL